ncbi:MAG: RsiG family protein [Acidimicrobiales bacterium]
MSLTGRDVNELCSPAYLDGLDSAPVTELRSRREACQRAEAVLSYLRRVMQGEMDLVLAEIEHRGEGGRSDIGRLVEELPSILTSSPPAQFEFSHLPVTGTAAPAELVDVPGDLALEELLAQVLASDRDDSDLPGGLLPGANLCTFTGPELRATLERLRGEESTLSSKRRILHEQIDAIQAAIVDRYKSGVADADSLLA